MEPEKGESRFQLLSAGLTQKVRRTTGHLLKRKGRKSKKRRHGCVYRKRKLGRMGLFNLRTKRFAMR